MYPPSANPINIAIPTVTAQLPTIVAIADQNSVPCLRALAANKQTILIPQVAYTYSTAVNPAVQETPLKVIQPNGNQVKKRGKEPLPAPIHWSNASLIYFE